MAFRWTLALRFLGCLFALVACNEPSKVDSSKPTPSAAASTPATTASGAAAAPAKPQLAVDDTAAWIAGERVDLAAPDPAGRYATVLGSKKVVGEDLVLEAARDAKYPKIALIVAAATKANAKTLLIHTPKRDRSTGEIALTLRPKWSDCSAVGFISKDNSITAQTAAGRSGARFTHGMAGPDMTRGSEGVRKLATNCASGIWLTAADDALTWGVVADLIQSVAAPDDGGTPMKAREVALLSRPPGGGRRAEESL